MATRQINILLFICFLTINVIGQIDTLVFESNDKGVMCNDKGKTCKPCWLRYKDKSGRLIYEGEFYGGCCIGAYIERYDNGKLKVKGQFKTSPTKDFDPGKGDCMRQGSWTYYKLNGDIEKQEVYKDGVLIPSP